MRLRITEKVHVETDSCGHDGCFILEKRAFLFFWKRLKIEWYTNPYRDQALTRLTIVMSKMLTPPPTKVVIVDSSWGSAEEVMSESLSGGLSEYVKPEKADEPSGFGTFEPAEPPTQITPKSGDEVCLSCGTTFNHSRWAFFCSDACYTKGPSTSMTPSARELALAPFTEIRIRKAQSRLAESIEAATPDFGE